MAPKELEGDTLGQKHRGYNAILGDLITTHTVPETKSDDDDINNLLKIDVASHNRDVEYILEVLKSDDMLYVSRALSRCVWLVTDQQYANIINPDYLKTELFPNMTTKAIHKLLKHIRHNIKDETRAEQFYLNEKKSTDAVKWLPYCSVKFIEINIEKHFLTEYDTQITLRLFKRLCEKSSTVFEIILKKIVRYSWPRYLKVVTFLLKTDIDKYLDVLESNSNESYYGYPALNSKATEIIMKHSPTRVTEQIEKYITSIHIPTFAKFLSADDIKPFIYAQAKKDLENSKFSNLRELFKCDALKYFIRRLPKDEQFDFAKTVGLTELPSDAIAYRANKIIATYNPKPYVWFQFAPFDHAFEEITKMIPLLSIVHEKRAMLALLIKCADGNLVHIETIIKYFLTKHRTDELVFKIRFVEEILTHTKISKYDDKTWNLLNELFTIMNVYKKDSDTKSEIVNSIVIYNVLNGRKVPEVIEKKFSFKTLKSHKAKMNQEQQNKMFNYLYDYSLSKLKSSIANETDFRETTEILQNVMRLIKDWEKSFLDYPIVLNKIKELIKLKKENSWTASLSSLYNVNKSWRKHMFEESVALCPSEEVCLNALKHDPQLLTRYREEVDILRSNEKTSLRRLLVKLRIYWPQSLAQQWIDTYLNNTTQAKDQKAAVKNLCILLPQKPLLDMIEKYKPENAKIDWKVIDDNVLNVQRILAKNMHLGRPQPNPDAILSYAKGDYLQSALPSLLAIFYNLKTPINNQYIPKLLNSPVSLQKHGIRLALHTLGREELQHIFLNCWKNSKNASIRTLIFKFTFKLLSSERDPINATSLWELLELFIDNLTLKEDKATYELLSKVQDVPNNVKAKFLVKSYNFLQKLIPTVDKTTSSNYKWYCVQLAEYASQVIDTIDTEFVLKVLQDFIENDFFKSDEKFMRPVHHSHGIIGVMSAYLLNVANENEQIKKYEKFMVPLLQRSLERWEEKREGNYFIKRNFRQILKRLSFDLKDYVKEKQLMLPVKMFSLIQIELEKSLSVPENYLILTEWKLTVTLAKLAEENSHKLSTDTKFQFEWDETSGLELGKICLEYLKNDVKLYFPCIYVLFSKSVKCVLFNILPENAILKFYEGIIADTDFIQGYLSAIEIGEDSRTKDEYKMLWEKVVANPSVEVKMHYYIKIDDRKRIY